MNWPLPIIKMLPAASPLRATPVPALSTELATVVPAGKVVADVNWTLVLIVEPAKPVCISLAASGRNPAVGE